MKRKLSVSGSGWHIFLNKSILQLLGFVPKHTNVLFTVKNKILYIEAIEPEKLEEYKDLHVRKLARSGGGWGLYITNPILELLDINPETDLVEYEVDERILKIKKAEQETN